MRTNKMQIIYWLRNIPKKSIKLSQYWNHKRSAKNHGIIKLCIC